MFQQRRQASLGNINLGNLSTPPSYEDIAFVLEQAMRYRGRFVEVTWAVPKTGETFQLTAKIITNQPLPSWMLYRGAAGNSHLIWGHNSNDVTLMHNLVMLECEKPVEGGGNNISAESMDSLVNNNRSAGAIAGGAADQDQPVALSQLSGQSSGTGQTGGAHQAGGANQAAAASQSGGGNPSATWLQNLSYGQDQPAAQQQPSGNVPQTAAGAQVDSHGGPQTATAPPVNPAQVATPEPASEIQDAGTIDLSLDGSLSNISAANLFRYLATNRLSGRLAVQSSAGAGEVFFSTGAIHHAATLESKGENALFDISTWGDGDFHFYADEQTAQATVTTEPAVVVEGCQRIVQYFRALIEAGLHPASYLVRTQELNRQQFEQTLQSGLPVDIHTQFRFYEKVSGNQTFAEILRACPLVRAEWIPVVYNLLRCGLLAISDRPATARPGMYLEGEPVDALAIESFLASASELDGFLQTGPFLYLLQQEFHRHERTGSRFALALFSVAKTNLLDGVVTPIDPDAFAEAARRIMQAKRKLDIIGHFDAANCAMLLPETDAAGAAVFANRITQLLKKPPLTQDMGSQVLVHSFGIASIPDDARDLETLISAVRVAKNKSRMMGAPVILYGDQAK